MTHMTLSWPPRSSSPTTVLSAYTTVLGWPLSADGAPVEAADVERVRERSPRAVWSVLCGQRFDVVAVPARLGRELALLIERDLEQAVDGAVLPCLLGGEKRFFLVRAGSARDIPTAGGVQVLSGEQRLVLPSSPELRWETPPWSRTEPVAVELPDGDMLVERLAATAPDARR
ncbi:hypothetical protein BV309_34295 [Streptomyces clavuligerus]|uniref:Uncharacterized protein n=2 Tax=Streptomyces clavuligerus TaxID=1901 RepID=D5SJ22_STRCL|nr:hypothetical protein [Streptomyces clavuligerus]EFG03915.1 Hypothetical protein SCLAV_p0425 [Streptomyces clavuligerus]MBY6307580.1 hypothetical protein [Streptomyces clavuligerus]WDN56571.1 hypothetical protein LL058_32620 [Streptomyces clavuligerus]